MLNFKLKGSCEIRVTDSRSGEVKQVIEKENLITNHALYWVLEWVPRGIFDYFAIGGNGYGTNIFISANTTIPNANASGVSILAEAYTPNGITKKTFYPNANPVYGQLQQRIDYTGQSRTFQTVGLKDAGRTNLIYAYLLLDTPCTQGEYDYLDLFYRVQFINDGGQGLSDEALLDFARGCFDVNPGFDMSWASIWVGKEPSSNSYFKRYAASLQLQELVYGYQFSRYLSVNGFADGTHFKWKMNFSANKDQCVGWIFSSFLQTAAGAGGYHTIKNIQNPNSPFQNIFTHSANATVPFFDSLTSAAGNGKIKTSGNWTGKFPELYKISMVNGGATGVATYKYSVRKHLGFNGNSYSDLAINSPYRIDLPGFHGMKEENNDLLRWSNTQIVQYDQTGVMLLDVYDGSYKIWDASTTPQLAATQIRQCAVDITNQKIYVGCRTTGLWVIDVVNNALAHPFTNGCYGVDVGRNNVAYVLIDGGLYKSSDWSTPISFTYAGVTDFLWSKVLFLKADPEHAEDRLCLVVSVPGQSNKIVWYRVTPPTPLNVTLTYSSNGDANGVAYYIGTNYGTTTWSNPHNQSRVVCQMSSVQIGSPADLVDRAGGANHHTQNIPNSWESIDLGDGNSLIPTYYTLQNRGQYRGNVIRNWKLQGSNNVVSNSVADLEAAIWTDLDIRINNTTMPDSADAWGNYAVTGVTTGYRWFRILQNGVESSGTNHLLVSEIELYGSFTKNYTAFNGPQSSSIKSYPASLDVSDTGSFWASGAGRLTFDSKSLGSLGGSLLTSNTYTHSIYGSDAYYKIAFYNSYLMLADRIVDINGTTVNTFTNFTSSSGRSAILHLDSGITILSNFLRQMFTDNSYCWNNFGWDGGTWILNHSGAKTTHASDQLLGNGISIRFLDNANAPHFIGTDYFIQSICFGKHKDNSSEIKHNSAWYSVGAIFDAPINLVIPSSPTPPAAARHWRLRNLNYTSGRYAQYRVFDLTFTDSNGVDITTGGMASATYNSGSASNAFDKNNNTYYTSGNYYGNVAMNLQYTFANDVSVCGVTLFLNEDSENYQPSQFAVESSPDGINWSVVWSFDRGSSTNFTSTISNYFITVPTATLPDFRRIETDSKELHLLLINDVPVTNVYANNSDFYTAPGINEVWISSNGKVYFNSANAGATLTGAYAYLKF